MSCGLTTPEKRSVCSPPFIAMLRSPATTRWPLGSTLITETAICPLRLPLASVSPEPLYESLPDAVASALSRRSTMPTLLEPPGPLTASLLSRLVSVLLFCVALSDSLMATFSESPTWRARRSVVKSEAAAMPGW